MQGDFRIGERLVRPMLNLIEFQETTLRLEPKVMQVLLVLAEHGGDVVTRQAIREAVWPDIFVGDDVLIRAISELRRAFQDDPHTHHTIETIPKVGYRLIAPLTAMEAETEQETEHADTDVAPAAEISVSPGFTPPTVANVPGFAKRHRELLFLACGFATLLAAIAATILLPLFHPLPFPTTIAIHSGMLEHTAVEIPHESCPLFEGAVYEIENQQTGSVLEVPYASAINGTLLEEWKSNQGENQHWILKADGPYWTFTNVASGKLLDVPGGARTVGIQLDQWQPNHGGNQNWIVLPAANKTCKIISQASGLLVDVSEGSTVNGTPIIQYLDNDGLNQHWIFRLVKKPVTERPR